MSDNPIHDAEREIEAPDLFECCGNCGMGLCYVDHMTGEASEGFGWEYR